jgi:putative endonuclease
VSVPSVTSRRKAERRGRISETIATLWLLSKGYRILAQRARTPYGEVDIVAMKGGALVIVEVKARPSLEAGVFAVSLKQRGRLIRAGQDLARRYRLGNVSIRFDLIVRRPGRWFSHLRGAWRADDGAF